MATATTAGSAASSTATTCRDCRAARAERAPARYSGRVNPYEELGGAERIRAIVERFYDLMHEREPELARLHACTPEGVVDRGSRDRFAMFLIGWLGGPDDYIRQHGHPRLRMRHNRVAVNLAMRDAWLR